jgi:hypothetical protein
MTLNISKIMKPKLTETEKKIYKMLSTHEGLVFLDWLRDRTIEKQIGAGVSDGIQTAIMTARELGRSDIYHEIKILLSKVSSYDN